jgi:hypothetical protein
MSQNITPGQVRYIQTMRRRLGLEEDDYRLMLWNVAGVKSCKLLRGGKVEAVIRHLERCLGKGPSEVSSQKAAVGEPGPAVLRATLRQIEEIRRRWGPGEPLPAGAGAGHGPEELAPADSGCQPPEFSHPGAGQQMHRGAETDGEAVGDDAPRSKVMEDSSSKGA